MSGHNRCPRRFSTESRCENPLSVDNVRLARPSTGLCPKLFLVILLLMSWRLVKFLIPKYHRSRVTIVEPWDDATSHFFCHTSASVSRYASWFFTRKEVDKHLHMLHSLRLVTQRQVRRVQVYFLSASTRYCSDASTGALRGHDPPNIGWPLAWPHLSYDRLRTHVWHIRLPKNSASIVQGGPKNRTVFWKFETPVYVDIE